MATARQVAQYAASKQTLAGEVQQQKLVYYAQAWSLAWDGVPLFDDEIEAWKRGPVVPTLWGCVEQADANALVDDREKSVVDAVVDFYGRQPGWKLSRLTHEEEPWKAARAGLSADAWSSAVISQEVMRRTYTQQAIEGKGPRRLSEVTGADSDEVLELAASAEKQWSRTLDLLAQ